MNGVWSKAAAVVDRPDALLFEGAAAAAGTSVHSLCCDKDTNDVL
jgi:hypothetical protein